MSGSTTGSEGRPTLRIVRGDPSPEERAAVVVALAAASGGASEEEGSAGSSSHWAAPARLVREPVHPSGWWQSALPR